MRKATLHYTADADLTYEQNHEEIIRSFVAAGCSDEFEADGNKYKTLSRGDYTTFYSAAGDTLFEIDNARLDEIKNETEVPENRKSNGATKENEAGFGSGEEKLRNDEKEMLASVKDEFKDAMKAQLDLIFDELVKWTRRDPEFEKKVLLDHKNMKRCMKFCGDKAMKLREPSDQEKTDARNNNIPIMTPVGSDMLFDWIREYFDKDDKEEVEKEKKKVASKKKVQTSKKPLPEKNKEDKPANNLSQKKQPEKNAVEKKKKNNSVSGQISLFDLLG